MTSSTSPQTSTPTDQSAPRSEPESRKGDWAGGLTVFAGVILIVVGLFQFFQGLAAIVKGSFYVVAPNNIYEFSVSGWGWIHLVLGIVLAVTATSSSPDNPGPGQLASVSRHSRRLPTSSSSRTTRCGR